MNKHLINFSFQDRHSASAASQLGLRREAEAGDRQVPEKRFTENYQTVPRLRPLRIFRVLHRLLLNTSNIHFGENSNCTFESVHMKVTNGF
jgi:hypothetical protein